MQKKWVEVIRACGLHVVCGDDENGNIIPSLYDTEEEVLEEIDSVNAEYQAQIELGEREDGDEYEGFPIAVLWDGERLFTDDSLKQELKWKEQ